MLSGKNEFYNEPNYFIQKAIIKNCELAYRQLSKFNSNKVNDVVLKLTLQIEKKDNTMYDKTIEIIGNYKRNDDMTVNGWGTAFKIKAFFNTIGLNDWSTDDMGVIPNSLCKAAIGKQLYILSYRTSDIKDGKRIYNTYKLFGNSPADVEAKFVRDVNSDYPPYNYEPSDSANAPFTFESEDEDII